MYKYMRSHERQIVKKGFKSLTGTEQTGRRRRKRERGTGGGEGGGEQGREGRGGREAGSSSPLLIFQLVFIVPTLLSARLRCIFFWLVLTLFTQIHSNCQFLLF